MKKIISSRLPENIAFFSPFLSQDYGGKNLSEYFKLK